ncbi:MAG: CHAT domain-containing protein [Anaerolineae bacterium]
MPAANRYHSEQILEQAAQYARQAQRDPARMLRVVALLAAPVHDPQRPDRPPESLDLRTEWRRLEQAVRVAHAPILLVRLVPPILDALRRELSPRADEQDLFPHVLHFSGHAWAQGLLLEDEYGQNDPVSAARLLQDIRPPRPVDLVVLNACETAAEAHSASQALVDAGLARAVVGHPLPVLDDQAIAFARTLYADLTDGYPLSEAVDRAQRHVTTHDVVLLGDADLRFTGLTRGGSLVSDARPRGNLPPGEGVGFFGRGEELVYLARHLDQPPCVALISGPQGIGKSRLALEAAHRNAWRFPAGVAYAEAPREPGYATAAALLNRLAESLGIAGANGGAPRQPAEANARSPSVQSEDEVFQALLAHAHTTSTLFVLDNLETLPEAELRTVAEFLGRLGGSSAAIATLRPPLPALEDIRHATSLSLHEGLSPAAASRYALALAHSKGLSLTPQDAGEIALATSGHPLLITSIVARTRRRDRQALLEEVRRHQGDFAAQVEAVYAWSAARIGEAGRRAWATLPFFPAGWVPEVPLRALVGPEGAAALRDAAVADFDPRLQGWRWHPTAAEYAARHWSQGEDERRERLAATLPAWAGWLERLRGEVPATANVRLEEVMPNLEPLLESLSRAERGMARQAPREAAWSFLQALDRVLPAPDRTLALRGVQAPLYRAMADLASDDTKRARALGMLGYALSALGRRGEALAATQEAVELYRQLAQHNPDAFLPDLAMSLNNLGIRLSNLGRRGEALAATQEAVEIRRQLAQHNPDAFLPDLATSLNNLGDRLSELDRPKDALRAYEEAVRTLAPYFLRLPAAFVSRMEYMAHDYIEACQTAGREPDGELLGPVVEVLQGLAEGEGE